MKRSSDRLSTASAFLSGCQCPRQHMVSQSVTNPFLHYWHFSPDWTKLSLFSKQFILPQDQAVSEVCSRMFSADYPSHIQRGDVYLWNKAYKPIIMMPKGYRALNFKEFQLLSLQPNLKGFAPKICCQSITSRQKSAPKVHSQHVSHHLHCPFLFYKFFVNGINAMLGLVVLYTKHCLSPFQPLPVGVALPPTL